MASRNPFNPSMQATKMSYTPQFLISGTTCSQNLAPLVFAIQVPSSSFSPVMLMPSARWTTLARTLPEPRTFTWMNQTNDGIQHN